MATQNNKTERAFNLYYLKKGVVSVKILEEFYQIYVSLFSD
jgi:hypothetical protein